MTIIFINDDLKLLVILSNSFYILDYHMLMFLTYQYIHQNMVFQEIQVYSCHDFVLF